MQIRGTFLRSRVARRIFVLFVASAFLPVAVLAYLSYDHMHELVQSQEERRLLSAGTTHMHSVYDRLLGASFVLDSLARLQANPEAEFDATQIEGHGAFRRVFRLTGADLAGALGQASSTRRPWISGIARAHLEKGEIALLPARPGSADSRPWLARAANPPQLMHGIVAAELEDEYVWGNAEDLTHGIQVCVFGEASIELTCSDKALSALAREPGLATPAAHRESRDSRWVIGSKALFLRPKFGAPDWTFVTLLARDAAAPEVQKFAMSFLGVAILTLLLASFLSLMQIRRTLVPIERLVEGTRRIADEVFDRPVTVQRSDEFGELAHALNGMALRLGRQIGAMRALSEIDQEILTRLDVEQVVERVHTRLCELLPNSGRGVIVYDGVSDGVATAYLRQHGPLTQRRKMQFDAAQLAAAVPGRAGRWIVHAAMEHLAARHELDSLFGETQTFAVPVLWRERICGMLVIGAATVLDVDAEISRQLSGLGDRVAIAMAARAREEQLIFHALHDELTTLPNRRQLHEHLVHELARAQRESTGPALLFIDLDRFKSINDTLGHAGGDALLRAVAERLTASVRPSDFVARVGGDEFVVVLSTIHSSAEAARVAQQIVAALLAPVRIQNSECVVGASIGIALFPGDARTVDELLQHADSAMYRAKSAGRGCVMFYEESMNVEERERAELLAELRLALARNQLEVHYQPRVEMNTGRFVSVEALVRWRHPRWGWVSPGRFIPLAEDIGLIEEIGTWVLEQACGQLAGWQAAGLDIERVSVNVSGRQLRTDALVDTVARTLAATALPPHALELEVTESLLLDNVATVVQTLSRIRASGVTVALDDFGTGYSSLNYLRRLPIDVLKIDQSFVRDLEGDASARGIAQAIIAMAHALHKSVTAEGVETLAQAELLRQWGCREAQGYYFGRPVAPDVLAALLPQRAPRQLAAGPGVAVVPAREPELT